MQKIILASNNLGKEREFNNIFKKFDISVISMREFDIPSPKETGLTFIENAILKARNSSKITKMPAIADDSGLVVDQLQGAPGIYSSRFSGEQNDMKNNLLLLKKMQNLTNRKAYFFSCIVFLKSYADPVPLIATGIWQGKIAENMQGDNGFGYDSVFIPKDYIQNAKKIQNSDKTVAMLTMKEKNSSSHRAKAVQNLVAQLEEYENIDE